VVRLEDDLDGSKAAETVSFSLDGVAYEIDLSVKNSEKLRRALQRYTNAGRRVGGRSTRGDRGNGTARSDPAQLAAIRDRDRHNGHEVGDRGRIPVHIVEQYHVTAGPLTERQARSGDQLIVDLGWGRGTPPRNGNRNCCFTRLLPRVAGKLGGRRS
jgi:hypothetical protein